jgi:lipoprotein NlpI
MPLRFRHVRIALLLGALAAVHAIAAAQPPAAKAGAPRAPTKTTQPAKPAVAGEGYQLGKVPEWVKPVAADTRAPAGAPALGYRHLLMDSQTLVAADGTQQNYAHTRTAATDGNGVQLLSKAELYFNPAYQTLVVHEASVYRDGRRLDRLKDARIELLRREEGLDKQTLTGVRTLLIVMNDIRVGDVVDVAYTVNGSNPIFKGRFSETLQLGFPAPVDKLHVRIEYPAGRPLQSRGIRFDRAPELFAERGRQVMRLQLQDVPAVVQEEGTPPWFKVYPALHVSDHASWQAVATWADELFSSPGDLGPELNARIEAWRARNLPRDQLASEVLAFVQDDVRYFSASLGESSHRPKAPARTYAERLGDCKDKVALLDAVLRALGFDARPALVSMFRNRGVADYLPSHDQFDHVVTRLVLDGQVHWLDGTLQKQGHQMKTRGTLPYGMVLVADAATTGLTAVERAPGAADAMEFSQVWDVSDLGKPVRITSVLRARGLSAELWRNSVANGGAERIADHLAGVYARVMPEFRKAAPPVVRDDLDTNVFELESSYQLPRLGTYMAGSLAVELPAMEMLDTLVGPREARREMPFEMQSPRQMKQRVRVIAPSRFTSTVPAPVDIGDRHFNLNARYILDGSTLDYVLSYERRADEVAPADLSTFRERIQQARRLGAATLRLPLVDFAALRSSLGDIDRRVVRSLGKDADALREQVTRQEVERLVATEALKRTVDNAALTGSVLNQRAIATSMLDDAASTLEDTDRVIRLAPEIGYAHYTRGLALLSLGRPAEAEAALRQYQDPADRAMVDHALGGAQYYSGQYAQAESSFRRVVDNSNGDGRLFALLWLYIAAERQGGKGQQALAPHVDAVDRNTWPGVLVHCLAGKATPDDVLRQAKQDKRMERLNLAEAHFYMGQQLLLAGKADDARRLFQRTGDIRATPHMEYAYAQMELQRAKAR